VFSALAIVGAGVTTFETGKVVTKATAPPAGGGQ
jgi:hypothetical protein